MARPRIIHWPAGGEIVLRNISAEESAKIIKVLTGEEREEIREKGITMPDLPNVALSTFKDTEGWKVAIVRYDPVTGLATVERVKLAGPDRYDASELFKLLVVENDLI